jgi:hypothetical protein
MNRYVRSIPAALLATTLVLSSACSREPAADPASSADDGSGPRTALGRVVGKAMDEARAELENGNISLSASDRDTPKAEITPQGDLLVGGRAVTITPAQRTLLQEYRGHVVAVASRGMDIGMQGADLAARAMGEALKGIVSGKSEAEIERNIEAEADAIQVAAHALCNRLPDMLASQRRLAAALPAFVPYATMTESDLEDCRKETDAGSDDAPAPAQAPEPEGDAA